MKLPKRKMIFAALLCIAAGMIILAVTAVSIGFDVTRLNTTTFEKKTTTLSDDFDSIVIGAVECDVTITYVDTPIAGNPAVTTPTVISHDSEGIVTEVTVENGTLYITRKDKRPWYEHIGISYWDGNRGITVFLPKDQTYEKLSAVTLSGNITVMPAETLVVADAEIQTTSGDIIAGSIQASRLKLRSTSGNVQLSSADADTLETKTVSGDIELKNTTSDSFSGEATSGCIALHNLSVTAHAALKTVSGDIELRDCSFAALQIQTTSGDVEGSIRTPMIYQVRTTSGDIRVPESKEGGGTCEIVTTSGDVELRKSNA